MRLVLCVLKIKRISILSLGCSLISWMTLRLLVGFSVALMLRKTTRWALSLRYQMPVLPFGKTHLISIAQARASSCLKTVPKHGQRVSYHKRSHLCID